MTTQNTVRNLGAQNLGVLEFNGSRKSSNGLCGDQFAFAEFTVPDPIPANMQGKMSRIAAYAPTDGGLNAQKWMCVDQVMGQWDNPMSGPSCVCGLSVQVLVSFGVKLPNCVMVRAGERWYVNIQNRLPYMGGSLDTAPSCGPGNICDFTMDASVPTQMGG